MYPDITALAPVTFKVSRVKLPLFEACGAWYQPPPTRTQRFLNRVGSFLGAFAAPLQHQGPLWFFQPPETFIHANPLISLKDIRERRFDIIGRSQALAEQRLFAEEETLGERLKKLAEQREGKPTFFEEEMEEGFWEA